MKEILFDIWKVAIGILIVSIYHYCSMNDHDMDLRKTIQITIAISVVVAAIISIFATIFFFMGIL